MKKTTVVIDETLLQQAVNAIGAKSKKEAIHAGLETLVRMKKRAQFRMHLGTFDLNLDLKTLEELRHAG